MATLIPEIPHSVTTQWLLQKAVVTRRKVKYYMVSRQSSREILIRYVTPFGNITNGKGKRYSGFAINKPRFLNYWHAYAYRLQLEATKED